jgi:CRP-like cAMP-binding protein
MGILIECHLQTYKASDILYEEKTNSNHIYFIVNGQVELSK